MELEGLDITIRHWDKDVTESDIESAITEVMERRLLEYATEICTGENKPYSVEYDLSAISPYSVSVHIIPNYEPQEDVLVFYSNFIFACGEFGERSIPLGAAILRRKE